MHKDFMNTIYVKTTCAKKTIHFGVVYKQYNLLFEEFFLWVSEQFFEKETI